MSYPCPDRLVILIVSGTQVDSLMAHLVREKFIFTMIHSTSGMLQEPEVCLLVGFESQRLPILLELVRKNCRPYLHYVSTQGYMQSEMANPSMLEAKMGGARLYMMNVEHFEQI